MDISGPLVVKFVHPDGSPAIRTAQHLEFRGWFARMERTEPKELPCPGDWRSGSGHTDKLHKKGLCPKSIMGGRIYPVIDTPASRNLILYDEWIENIWDDTKQGYAVVAIDGKLYGVREVAILNVDGWLPIPLDVEESEPFNSGVDGE